MSIHYTKERYEEAYNRLFAENKAKGMSDRDADIMTIDRMYPRSIIGSAEKHGMTIEEVREVYRKYN